MKKMYSVFLSCIVGLSSCLGVEEAKKESAVSTAGEEILKNRDFSAMKDGQPENWRFYTYKDCSKISIADETYKDNKVVCIESDNLKGKGYISQELKDLKIADKTSFKISGYYKTENIGIDKDGKCFVEIKYNGLEKDKKLLKYQQKVLPPAKEWAYFEYVKDIEPPVKDLRFMAILYNCSGKIYFSGLSVTAQKIKSIDTSKQIYIWREAEGLCLGFANSNYKPQEFKNTADYFSGGGAVYNTKKEPFIWNFKEKSEVDPETLFTKKNTYKIWLRLYGYRQMPLMNVELDNKKIASFKTKKTEKTDDKGEYTGAGEFYWQEAGEFTGEGGNHKLKISSDGPFGIDAILITTDISYQPKSFETREIANKDFFTDIKSGPVIKAEYKVCGVSDKIVSPLLFRPHIPGNTPIKIKNDEAPAVFHIDMPACIDIKNVSSHWAGTSWNYESRWGNKFLTYKKVGEKTIENEKYNSYEIYLYYLWIDIFVFVKGNSQGFEYGKDKKCFYSLEYKGTKEAQEKLHIRTVEMKPTKAFSEIFIGPAGKCFKSFYCEYPDVTETMTYTGINFLNVWSINIAKDKELWDKFVKKCLASKIIVTAEFSLLCSAYGPVEKDDFAIDINGKKVDRASICMDLKGKTFQKNLTAVDELLNNAVTGIAFDDENYNQYQDKIDYSKRSKEMFEQYLNKKNIAYKDPVEIVKNKDKEKALYNLWVDFKCDMVLERYKILRARYDESLKKNTISTTQSRKFFIPQILKNKSPQESRENSYWDYKKLAEYSTHISPMIYTYQGIKDSHIVGDTIKMYNDYIGKYIIAPTLLAGHGDFGEVALSEKKMLKYQVFESLMNKAPGIIYWETSSFFDPLNLSQISEAIRIAQPYEEFFLKGEPCNTVKASPEWARIIALKHENKILIYAANYRNETDKKIIITLDKKPLKVMDLEKNKEVEIKNFSFETDFLDERGKLFLVLF
ncbi:MAG: hypothetical protein A2017_01535 [Lentisphaerae bacterium GWF2_44_16]|nr:MAG: hypothetical protein A2017_01535 [Lentisphaerae bacterium GWF2_44_16]